MKGKWLKTDDLWIPWNLPTVPACYVVYADGAVCYVGSTVNLRQRAMAHRFRPLQFSEHFSTPWGQFNTLTLKYKTPRREGDWLGLEYRLIKRLKPAFNKRGVPSV
jgi:excinuclease UvrABC nuclease subunit